MKPAFRLPFAALLLSVACTQSELSSSLLSGTGGLGLQLKLSPQVTISGIQYQLSLDDTALRSGTFAPAAGNDSFSGFVGGLQPATGYRMVLESNAMLVGSSATTRCSGTASFGIAKGETTTVAVRLRCDGVAGDDVAGPTTPLGNSCPSISVLRAQPASAAVGQPIRVEGEAIDADRQPRSVTFRWSAPAGSFSSAVEASTTFACTSPGPTTLALVVSDGDPMCPLERSTLQVSCIDDVSTDAHGGMGSNAGSTGAKRSAAGHGGITGSLAGTGGQLAMHIPNAGRAATQPPAVPQAGRVAGPDRDAGPRSLPADAGAAPLDAASAPSESESEQAPDAAPAETDVPVEEPGGEDHSAGQGGSPAPEGNDPRDGSRGEHERRGRDPEWPRDGEDHHDASVPTPPEAPTASDPPPPSEPESPFPSEPAPPPSDPPPPSEPASPPPSDPQSPSEPAPPPPSDPPPPSEPESPFPSEPAPPPPSDPQSPSEPESPPPSDPPSPSEPESPPPIAPPPPSEPESPLPSEPESPLPSEPESPLPSEPESPLPSEPAPPPPSEPESPLPSELALQSPSEPKPASDSFG